MASRSVDLTQGHITKQLVRFTLPILAGYVFQTLYNNVDSLVVGNLIGKETLAAVNTCTPIYNLLHGDVNRRGRDLLQGLRAGGLSASPGRYPYHGAFRPAAVT